jgi:hypothetical protein
MKEVSYISISGISTLTLHVLIDDTEPASLLHITRVP